MRVHSGKDREEMMPKTMFITRAKKVGDTKIGGHEAVVITIEGKFSVAEGMNRNRSGCTKTGKE